MQKSLGFSSSLFSGLIQSCCTTTQRQIVEMLTGPQPDPVCSMKRGLCQLQLAAYGVMSYQVWGSVYAYFILLHPSCSSKLIIVFTELLPQVLNCL